MGKPFLHLRLIGRSVPPPQIVTILILILILY